MPKNLLLKRAAAVVAAAVTAIGLSACSAGAASEYVTPGKFTVATGEPAYYPYVLDDDPTSGEGFESAVAYAVAAELGFAPEDVEWVRSTFDEAIAPGPKNYDINLQQISITDERKGSIDFSSPYYAAGQAVITIEGTAAANARSIEDLKPLLIGAATGTTSLKAIEQVIAPTTQAQVFNSNDDAKLALESGQIDAIVVDLPTAFFMTGVELDGGLIVGQLPEIEGEADEWGLVLPKGSPLTPAVTKAVDALRTNGTLAAIVEAWLGADQGVSLLK